MASTGVFNDGRSAARVEANLHAAAKGLEIRDPRDNLMLALWAYAELTPVKPLKPGVTLKKLRLTCVSDPEARLLIDDVELIGTLQKANKALRPPRKPLPLWARALLGAAIVLVVLLVVSQALVFAAHKVSQALPAKWDAALGDALDRQMIEHFGGHCGSPTGLAALVEIDHRLNQNSDLGFPITVQVVKDPTINAFGLPGGMVVVTSGLLGEAESAEQVAAVAAHEAAHVALRHVTEEVFRHAGLGLVLTLSGGPTALADGPLTGVMALAYGRQSEVDAQALGLALLEKADVDVQSMGNFFRMLDGRQRQRGVPLDFLTAHPLPLRREPQPFQPFVRPILPEKDWLALRAICR